MYRWRYASMLPRAIIKPWILILMIIASKFNCQLAIPKLGIINVPPLTDATRGGSTGGTVAGTNSRTVDEPLSGQVFNLTRQHDGDVFRTNGMSTCNADTCVGLSSGTAGLFERGTEKTDTLKPTDRGQDSEETCDCRCLPYLKTYREDLGICVDDIHECSLSPFVSGSSSEKIPFVFLPLRGQIIYPSREISFPDIHTPVCAVTGAQYLTKTGWGDLRNPIDTDYPFRMFRDEGRTFLQWLGETDLRQKMQGRLIVVHLMCRDMSITLNATKSDPLKNVFSPCVAFRVNGSPVKYFHNVSEVLFQSEASSVSSRTPDGMTTKEYIVIGICSLLLGLIYVSSVFLYLHMKKRKSQTQEVRNGIDDLTNEINYPKNDQVTFGSSFHRNGSVYSGTNVNSDHRINASHLQDDLGMVKNNPLLQHFPNLTDHHSGITSDISNSNSECEEGHSKIKQMQTSAHVHNSSAGDNSNVSNSSNASNVVESDVDPSTSPTQENERLPEENVSVIEDMTNEEKLENMKAIVNGTVRKKLYFNPAYFEPHLLQSPPPAAVEFLTKIREVIAIAKYKMASKRYQPSLIMIPEECPLRTPSQTGSQLLYSGTYASSTECQGCATNRCSGHVKNCGDKRNSIEKWLETVPHSDVDESNDIQNTNEVNKNRKSPPKTIRPPKSKPPPPPISTSNTPKIISHALKHITNNSVEINVKTESPPLSPSTPCATITITKNRNENLYTFAETGSEIYNNPKFNLHDSPCASQRSRTSSHRSLVPSKSPSQAIYDVHASYIANNNYLQNDTHRDINKPPSMVYETLAKDCPKGTRMSDYNSTMEKKIKDIYNRTQSAVQSIPAPDYSTLGRKTLRQYQPDSPVYRRRSPQYLIVDYETDSLERVDTKRKSSNSSSSPSSDVSSHLSPSLSTALPLEEEVEIRHTIYDKIDGFRKDGDSNIKKKVAKPSAMPSPQEIAARIKYDTPFRGSMTIEVEHEPQTDLELSTDSDQFEPDTLDRKPKKHSFCDVNAWTEHLDKSRNFVNCIDGRVSYSSLENMTNLPSMQTDEQSSNCYILRSSNSFRNSFESPYSLTNQQRTSPVTEGYKKSSLQTRPSFGSLREIYQTRNMRPNSQRPRLTSLNFTEQGRLLTLEAKHTRRQRVIPSDEPRAMPPDINQLVYDATDNYQTNTYEEILSKNSQGWSTNNFSEVKPYATSNYGNNTVGHLDEIQDERESASNHSESTEVTGVSDTQANSEVDDFKMSRGKISRPQQIIRTKSMENDEPEYCAMHESKLNNIPTDYTLNKYLSRKKSNEDDRTEDTTAEHERSQSKSPEDPNKIEILSMSSLSSRLSDRTKEMYRNAGVPIGIAYPQRNGTNVKTVYRCEVPPISNGMQIAMGLKDRAKKSKDLKNAWKKFVSIATSKFSPTSSLTPSDKTFTFLDRDDGICSLLEDQAKLATMKNSVSAPQAYANYYDHRYGHRLQDFDSGYISADSSEVYNRRLYDRFNFKMMNGRDHMIKENIIEDHSDIATGDVGNKTPTLERNHSEERGFETNDEEDSHDDDDNCSNRTLTKSSGGRSPPNKMGTMTGYSSEDEQSESRVSQMSQSETEGDEEPSCDALCESGAESVETHSVLYKNIRKS